MQGEDIKSCVEAENITICGEFKLTFEQGTISHMTINDQSLHARLHTNKENGPEIAEGIASIETGYENEKKLTCKVCSLYS